MASPRTAAAEVKTRSGGIEAENTSEVSKSGDLLDDLQDALEGDFEFSGSFSYAAELPSAPNPFLTIDGLGLIGLPLSERDAKAIIGCSEQAPYGHRERTIVNKDVRDTWEIEPARITFQNAARARFVETLQMQSVCAALGVNSAQGIPRCELYKLLLYETGSHFLPHQDTQKYDGMFATMIILLPSPYTGGQVHVTHGSTTKVIDLAQESMSTCALAWYTDVMHEVKPVQSGYRLALSYNLIHTSLSVPKLMLPDMHAAVTELHQVLERWKRDEYLDIPDEQNLVAYLLEHQYGELELAQGFQALKGADAHKIAHVQPVAEGLGFMVCLANLTYHESGVADDPGYGGYGRWKRRRCYCDESDHSDEDMDEEDVSMLEPLLDKHKLSLNETCLIPKDPFEGESPDDRNYEGYMGNCAGGLEYWYRRTVLILLHEKDALEVFCTGLGGFNYMLSRLKKSNSVPPTPEDIEIAGIMVHRLEATDIPQAKIMVDFAIKWQDLPISVMKYFGTKLLSNYGKEALLGDWKRFSFKEVKAMFSLALTGIIRLKERLDFISVVVKFETSLDEKQMVGGWCVKERDLALTCYDANLTDDIPTLIYIAIARGLAKVDNSVLKRLARKPASYAFWVAFINALLKHKPELIGDGNRGPDSTNISSSVQDFDQALNRSLNAILPQWQITPISSADHRYDLPMASSRKVEEGKTGRIIEITQLCIITGRMETCRQFLDLLVQDQSNIFSGFSTILTPLIPQLRLLLAKHKLDIFSDPFAPFILALLRLYLHHVLGIPGEIPQGFKIPKPGCGCADCKSLDAFFANTRQTEITFRIGQQRRQHLENRLLSLRNICSFTTIRSGSPHGLQINQSPNYVSATIWTVRRANALKFMGLIGSQDAVKKLMGDRWPDVLKALQGSQRFARTPLNSPNVAFSSVSTVGLDVSSGGSKTLSSTSKCHQKRKRPSMPTEDVIDLTNED